MSDPDLNRPDEEVRDEAAGAPLDPGPGELPEARDESVGPAAEPLADPHEQALADRDERIAALQRHAAELDNRRKRTERQMEERARYAHQDLVLQLLPVIDNFELALSHADPSRDKDALVDGLRLVHDQLLGVLKKFSVEKIPALGEPFDPNVHEAVGQMVSDDHPDHTVIDVHQEGYRLHDRVIRPARVIVSRRSQPSEGA